MFRFLSSAALGLNDSLQLPARHLAVVIDCNSQPGTCKVLSVCATTVFSVFACPRKHECRPDLPVFLPLCSKLPVSPTGRTGSAAPSFSRNIPERSTFHSGQTRPRRQQPGKLLLHVSGVCRKVNIALVRFWDSHVLARYVCTQPRNQTLHFLLQVVIKVFQTVSQRWSIATLLFERSSVFGIP